LAALAVGVGVAETVVAVRKSNDFNSLPEMCTDDGNGHITGGARCEQADHDQRVATWTAVIGFSVGGALATTALILHFVEPRPVRGGVATSLGCTVDGFAPRVTCAIHW